MGKKQLRSSGYGRNPQPPDNAYPAIRKLRSSGYGRNPQPLNDMAEAAGFTDHREVEIFSERNWWRKTGDEVVRVIKERYQTAV